MSEPGSEPVIEPGRFLAPDVYPGVSVGLGIRGPMKQDWRPPKQPVTDLLSPGERLVFQRLKELVLEPGSLSPNHMDLLKVAVRAIDRLSKLKADDFEFPEYACLVNQIACTAYLMRFSRRATFERTVECPSGEGCQITLDWMASLTPPEASLAVRAYVRMGPIQDPSTILALRGGLFSLCMDGEDLIKGEQLAGFLVHPDGTAIRRIPRVLPAGSALFSGVGLSDQHEADVSRHYGIMMPNGTQILMMIDLSGIRLPESVRLTAGLVAAEYTTKER